MPDRPHEDTVRPATPGLIDRSGAPSQASVYSYQPSAGRLIPKTRSQQPTTSIASNKKGVTKHAAKPRTSCSNAAAVSLIRGSSRGASSYCQPSLYETQAHPRDIRKTRGLGTNPGFILYPAINNDS